MKIDMSKCFICGGEPSWHKKTLVVNGDIISYCDECSKFINSSLNIFNLHCTLCGKNLDTNFDSLTKSIIYNDDKPITPLYFGGSESHLRICCSTCQDQIIIKAKQYQELDETLKL